MYIIYVIYKYAHKFFYRIRIVFLPWHASFFSYAIPVSIEIHILSKDCVESGPREARERAVEEGDL